MGLFLRLGSLSMVLLACGDNHATAVDATAPPLVDATVDAPVDAVTAARCEQYPVPVLPVSGAEAAAQAELATFSPAATMTWNDNTGTFSSILQLATPLPGCVDGQDVGAQVFGFLSAHPALFQLDLTEWPTPEFFDCKFADDALLNMGRRRIAGRPVAHDLFAYNIKRIAGVVNLTAVFGTYLPVAPAGVAEQLVSCNTLTAADAVAKVRQSALPATVFSLCSQTGTVSYTPQANDTFTLAADEAWLWEEGTGKTLLNGQRTLRVTLDPANYSAELMSSAARCPVTDPDSEDFTIGFDVDFDVNTGEIISVKPGLDCTVC